MWMYYWLYHKFACIIRKVEKVQKTERSIASITWAINAVGHEKMTERYEIDEPEIINS